MAARASAFPRLFLLGTYFSPYGIVFNPLLMAQFGIRCLSA
jgi:hypothetical protein